MRLTSEIGPAMSCLLRFRWMTTATLPYMGSLMPLCLKETNTATSEKLWLYAKTHWGLHFEMKVLTAGYTPQFSFLSKRFIKPKRFQNDIANGFQFLYQYAPSSTGTLAFYPPRPIN